MINVLIVGFGNMGCRHAQSLLNDKEKYKVHVVEPSQESIRIGCEKINAKPEDLNFLPSLESLNIPIDIAIVASSSQPRFAIVKFLLEQKIKYFLLEKIVFQSIEQFETIMKLAGKNKAVLYCNFVNRYFNVYNKIKEEIGKEGSSIKMTIYGGDFGLGCNAIHYVDLFSYIIGNKKNLELAASDIHLSDKGNKRGSSYSEFYGALAIETQKKNKLLIVADDKFVGGNTIVINSKTNNYIVNEQSLQFFKNVGIDITSGSFELLPTSRLTSTIVKEILDGTCRLTKIDESLNAHAILFNVFNQKLFGETGKKINCPIT